VVSSTEGADHTAILASWLQDNTQAALAGDEVPFLEAGTFLAELKSLLINRSANTASVFSINAMIPASRAAATQASCNPQDLVPSIAKIIRWMLGASGTILRVGPGILVCVHLSHRSVDPELIGLQIERSIKRIFKIQGETEGILKASFNFDPAIAESEQALIRFLSSL
jgi:hypothetical protein